jgi:lipopolysaccharide/colanic/teichoic acid biosynthesis glycosyltransferase
LDGLISNEFHAEADRSGAGVAAGARPPWSGDFHRLRVRLYAVMAAADAALMAAAFLAANALRPWEPYGLTTFAVLWPVFFAVGLNGGAYSIQALVNPRRSMALAVQALLFAIVVATLLFFSLKIGEDFSRLVFGAGCVLAFVLVAAGRLGLGRAIGRNYGWKFRREILIADGVEAPSLGNVTVLRADRDALTPSTDDPAMLDRLGCALDGCERVILACPAERRDAWSRMLAGANVDVEIIVPELDRLGALGMRRYGSQATVLVGCGPLPLRARALKRAFDIASSASALLLLLPLFAIIAVAIRLDSPGPVFFHQARMGRGNRLFRLVKFRTMRADAADANGDRSVGPGDERLTRLGGFLRRTSLDELPQLVNVLRGEMSIVGPRPHALGSTAEDDPFWKIEERYWDRHAIRPGMTGLAQVRGLRGATARRADLSDRLQADLEYLDDWHVGRDVGIVVRTIGVLLHRNAY